MTAQIPEPVAAVIDALARDTAEGLMSYLQLDVNDRAQVRALAAFAVLDWLEQMIGAAGRAHPFAAVEAALALQRAETHAASAQWGPARALLEAHAHLLAGVPRAKELLALVSSRLA